MEVNFSSIVEYCDSCNLSFEPWNIRQYEVLYQGSKIHDQDKIRLCNICSKIAKYAEQLFHNLQGNSAKTPEVCINKKPIKNLSIFNLGTLQLSENDDNVSNLSITSAKNGKILTEYGKVNVKIEKNFYEVGISDDGTSNHEGLNEAIVKQEYLNEGNNPHKKFIEVEIKLENDRDRNISESESDTLSDNSLETDKVEESSNKEKPIKVSRVKITTEQFMQEKLDKTKTERYQNTQYKCTDCVVGFFCEDYYLKHMEKHSESAGPYECELCTQHVTTLSKLQDHMKIHLTRYKCPQCNILRNQLSTIREHLHSVHNIGSLPKFKCDQCSIICNKKSILKYHKKSKHSPRTKVTCSYCQKMYSSLESLKKHILLKHPEELKVKVRLEKKHICQECGAAFRAPSLLKTHMLKHSDRKDYYCVECDKSFKSETVLKTHLRTTLLHVQNSELPFACTQCEKRFSLRRNLDRHINAIHLNIKPYQCDLCPKAFSGVWSLHKHKKIVHEKRERPLKYKCEFCDKAFATRRTVEAHIRTHTGERPFQCDKCEATFTHSGSLHTHNKLVHLKLKRNRKPK